MEKIRHTDKQIKLEVVEEKIEKIWSFLAVYLPLANCHMTDFFTHDLWKTKVNSNVWQQLIGISEEDLILLPSGELFKKNDTKSSKHFDTVDSSTYKHIDAITVQGVGGCFDKLQQISNEDLQKEFKTKMTPSLPYTEDGEVGRIESVEDQHLNYGNGNSQKPDTVIHTRNSSANVLPSKTGKLKQEQIQWQHESLKDFILEAQSRTLPNLGVISRAEDLFVLRDDTVVVKEFMSPKKGHEVEVMAAACANMSQTFQINQVVDIGSGRGYLSSYLSLKYKLPVIGIDSSSINTKSAKNRNKLLGKQWTGLMRRSENLQKHDKTKQSETLNDKTNFSQGKGYEDGLSISDNVNGISGMQFSGKYTETINLETTYKEVAHNDVKQLQNEEECNSINCGGKTLPHFLCSTNENVSLAFEKCCSVCDNSFPEDVCAVPNDKNNVVNENSLKGKTLADRLLVSGRMPTDLSAMPKENARRLNKLSTKYSHTSEVPNEEKSLLNRSKGNEEKFQKKCLDPNMVPDQQVCCTFTPLTLLVDIDTDLEDILKNSGRNESEQKLRLLLTGLHTCGNLGPDIMKLFVRNESVVALCNVGCCYQLLDEEFVRSPYLNDDEPDSENPGFPMSSFLRNQHCGLGRNSRNMACQAVDRGLQCYKAPIRSIFWRALLQVILGAHLGYLSSEWQIGKIASKCSSFIQYVRKAFKKLRISDEKLTDEDIILYEKRYKEEEGNILRFFQLRTVLAPCIESLILLDRACYLLEQPCVDGVNLVQMFDPVISPRCYGIVASKKN